MDTRFDPRSYESRWQREWSERGWFRAPAADGRPAFCIMIPPPNVTGKLHMGHALQSTLQDLLIRWRRMQGYNALWLPGHRPRRHRDPADGRARARREGTSRGSSSAASGSSSARGSGRSSYHDNIRRQLDAMGASLRLEPRAFHPRRRALARGARGVRAPLPRGADLPRRVPGQLVDRARHRDLGSRGRDADASSDTL